MVRPVNDAHEHYFLLTTIGFKCLNCKNVCSCSPIIWTLVGLSPAVQLFLNCLDGLGVWGLLLNLDHIWGGRFGGWREATKCRQCRSTIGVEALGLQLCLGQEHLPSLHLFLQLIIVRLGREVRFTLTTETGSNKITLFVTGSFPFQQSTRDRLIKVFGVIMV